MSRALSQCGSHSSTVREANERAVLTALRRLKEASKADLAREINLTQNTTGLIVSALDRRGLIEETRKRLGLRGQPATMLRLNPEGAYSIGLKLGRRTQQSLLVDFSGRVLKSRFRELAFPMPEAALDIALNDIAALRESLPGATAARLSGIGLAMPYNFGSWRRELDMPADVCAAWNAFDIGAELRDQLDLPVFVENDGTAAAVAELFNGVGATLDDFATIFIGAAIGGGLVLGGNYRSGVNGNAADVGLMPVGPSRLASAPRPRGRSDILLNRASANSLMRHLTANDLPITMTSQIVEAMSLRPDLVAEWVEDCVDALIVPLLTLSSLLDLQAVVVDGQLPTKILQTIVERLAVAMAANAPEARRPPKLLLGSLGRNAGALGAAVLPFYASFAADGDVVLSRALPEGADVRPAVSG